MSYENNNLKAHYDFVINESFVPGVVTIHAQHEDAFMYLTQECNYLTHPDGSCPLFEEAAGDFISDAEHAHFACQYK